MNSRLILSLLVPALTASVVWGGSPPVPAEEVKALIASYRERMAVSETAAPDVSDRETGHSAEPRWLDAFGGRECPKFSLVNPALLVKPGTWLAMGAAEEGSNPDNPTTAPAAQPMPWLIPYTDYSGDLWTRPALTGNWGGLRQELMDKGLRFDVHMVQTLQRNIAGGNDYRNAYTGSLDFGLLLDTGKAGLWPGGILKIRGEYRYGRSGNADTSALMPVNMNALYPVPGQDDAALSELNFTQFLAPWVGVTVGKYSPRDTNVFAHDETEQFMNLAFNFNPVAGTTLPLAALGAGLILRPVDWFMVTTMVLDSEGMTDTSGFPEVWQRGVTLLQTAELTIKPFGLPGHQRFSWTWSDRTRIQFQQNPRAVLRAVFTGNTAGLRTKSRDGCFLYDFDQYLYRVPGSEDRGVGIFGRFGAGDRDVNPIEAFYSIGVGGKGLIPGRENDSFGVGYYYLAINDTLPPALASRAQDEEGVELYYNINITPWLQITPDIQIIEPARNTFNTAVVAGIRMKIKF